MSDLDNQRNDNSSSKCRGTTRTGDACTRNATLGDFCWQHDRQIRIKDAAVSDMSSSDDDEQTSRRSFRHMIPLLFVVLSVAIATALYDAEARYAKPLAKLTLPLLTVASFCIMLDTLTRKELKARIGGFLIGESSVNFGMFEHAIVRSITNAFCDSSGKVSFFRVLAYSAMGSAVSTSALVAVRQYGAIPGLDPAEDMPTALVLVFIVLITVVSANLSVVSDYISVCITRKLFDKELKHWSLLPLYIATDAVLSSLVALVPLLATTGIATGVAGIFVSEDQVYSTIAPIFMATITSLNLAVFITIFQVLLLFAGLWIRAIVGGVLGSLRLFGRAVPVEDNPFCVIAVTAVLLAIPIRLFRIWLGWD